MEDGFLPPAPPPPRAVRVDQHAAQVHVGPAARDDPVPARIGPGQDLLHEILTEVRFPKYTGWGSHYEKFNRTAQSWSMVAIAAAVRSLSE